MRPCRSMLLFNIYQITAFRLYAIQMHPYPIATHAWRLANRPEKVLRSESNAGSVCYDTCCVITMLQLSFYVVLPSACNSETSSIGSVPACTLQQAQLNHRDNDQAASSKPKPQSTSDVAVCRVCELIEMACSRGLICLRMHQSKVDS